MIECPVCKSRFIQSTVTCDMPSSREDRICSECGHKEQIIYQSRIPVGREISVIIEHPNLDGWVHLELPIDKEG